MTKKLPRLKLPGLAPSLVTRVNTWAIRPVCAGIYCFGRGDRSLLFLPFFSPLKLPFDPF